MTLLTPAQAWAELKAGNDRFVRDAMEHVGNVSHRATLAVEQHPHAVVFGCSDSRVAAEIIFDQGLGETFVVRTAGHVVDTTVIGSILYGVEVLGAALVVVLGHDSCGAVTAAAEALRTGEMPSGFVRAVVDRVIPSIVSVEEGAPMLTTDREELKWQHVRNTVHMLHGYSVPLAQAVAEGRCAIVGLAYTLADGQVKLVESIGDIGE